jgi:hypothetical protein
MFARGAAYREYQPGSRTAVQPLSRSTIHNSCHGDASFGARLLYSFKFRLHLQLSTVSVHSVAQPYSRSRSAVQPFRRSTVHPLSCEAAQPLQPSSHLVVQPCSHTVAAAVQLCAAAQLCSRTAVQPFSRSTVQSYSRTTVQPVNREAMHLCSLLVVQRLSCSVAQLSALQLSGSVKPCTAAAVQPCSRIAAAVVQPFSRVAAYPLQSYSRLAVQPRFRCSRTAVQPLAAPSRSCWSVMQLYRRCSRAAEADQPYNRSASQPRAAAQPLQPSSYLAV